VVRDLVPLADLPDLDRDLRVAVRRNRKASFGASVSVTPRGVRCLTDTTRARASDSDHVGATSSV